METNLLVQYLLSTGSNHFDEFTVSGIEVSSGYVQYVEHSKGDKWVGVVPLWCVLQFMFAEGSK